MVALLFCLRPVSVTVGGEEIMMQHPQDSGFSPFLFNIYIKILSEVNCQHGVWYYQYTCTFSALPGCCQLLTKCLELGQSGWRGRGFNLALVR